MIAAILTQSPPAVAVHKLAGAGRMRGHVMVIVNYRSRFTTDFGSDAESASVPEWRADFGAIFAWLDPGDLPRGLAVMREYESCEATTPNYLATLARTCDREWQAQILAQRCILMPHTVMVHSPENPVAMLDSVGDEQWVFKLLSGSRSFELIAVVETRRAALLTLSRICEFDRHYIVQPYIAESKKKDIRVLVVLGRSTPAVSRKARIGAGLPTWKAEAMPNELNVQERSLAKRAARALDLGIADVTLLRPTQGPLVLDKCPFLPPEWWDQKALQSVARHQMELVESPATGH